MPLGTDHINLTKPTETKTWRATEKLRKQIQRFSRIVQEPPSSQMRPGSFSTEFNGPRREGQLDPNMNDISRHRVEPLAALRDSSRASLSDEDAEAEMEQELEAERRVHEHHQSVRLQQELDRSNAKIEKLRDMVNSQEEIINDRTSASVSSLAYNVSSSMSDSDVRLMLQQYWEGDFLAWCDSSVANLPVEHVKRVLADTNLILDEQGFDSFAKAHSEITQIPFLLLKTALADRLCREFLADPFFLLQQTAGRELLGVLNASFESANAQKASHWRVETIKLLAETHRDSAFHKSLAATFCSDFQPLIRSGADEEELESLFTTFAGLALRLWMIAKPIAITGLRELRGEGRHQLRAPFVKVDPVIEKQPDYDGVWGAVTKPLISSPRRQADGSIAEVVWSPAYVLPQ